MNLAKTVGRRVTWQKTLVLSAKFDVARCFLGIHEFPVSVRIPTDEGSLLWDNALAGGKGRQQLAHKKLHDGDAVV